ncbi:hypothetical protein Tco_0167664 [Tanacetum coccineum]
MYKEYLAEFWYSAKTLENSKVFFSTPTGGIYGKVGVNTFRNVIGAHYLPHSSEYVAPPFIDIVRPWFKTIGYGEVVPAKRTLKKVFFLLGGGNDASAASITEANPGNFAPSDFVPQQQGMNKGTKNTSYDYLFAGTDPYVLADQTKSINEGLETVLTQPITGKGASSVARLIEEETSSTIKLEDLAKLVSHVQPSFKHLDSPEDDPVIVVDDSVEDKDDEVFLNSRATNQVLILQSQKHKLELEKNKAEAALLKAQPSFSNVEQLKELLVKSLKTKFSNILSAHDFSSSLPTELKDLPFKLNELTREVKGLKKHVHELEIELPRDLKEIPIKLDDFTKNVTSLTSQVAELKTLQWELPAKFLSLPAQVLNSASSKAGDLSVPSAGQADTMPAEGKKNTNQATISYVFQRRAEKNAEKENLNNQQPKPTTPLVTTIIPPVITTTTTQIQSPP